MKPPIPPLLALACLLSACSSFQARTPPPAPELTGAVSTPWGVLPHYDQWGHGFRGMNHLATANGTGLRGSAKVILLMNRDGTVRDACVVESSGDPVVARSVLALYSGARYTLRLDSADEAPYVVNETVAYNAYPASTISGFQPADKGSTPSTPSMSLAQKMGAVP